MQCNNTSRRFLGLAFAAALLGLSASHVHAAGGVKGVSSSKKPIEINADNLEVFQEENKAIFTGHVVAIQDTMRLKSDKMTVYYRSPEKKEGETEKSEDKKDNTEIAAPGQDAIKKIEVEGNVFMTTPDETARGKRGVYNVEKEQLVLTQDVVLTRGGNTLKGSKLTYDMKQGKSVMSNAGTRGKTTGKKQRVRALFLPEDAKKKEE